MLSRYLDPNQYTPCKNSKPVLSKINSGNTMSDISDDKVHVKLMEFAKKMHYVPPDIVYSEDTFKRMCRGEIQKLWEQVICKVRPKDEVALIRKNLLLNRLKKKGHDDIKETTDSKNLKLINMHAEIEAAATRKEEHYNRIEQKVKVEDWNNMKRKQQIEDINKKIHLLKLIRSDLRDKVWFLESTTQLAGTYFLKNQNSKQHVVLEDSLNTPEAVLHACHELMQQIKDKQFSTRVAQLPSEQVADLHQQKAQLWQLVQQMTETFKPDDVFQAMLLMATENRSQLRNLLQHYHTVSRHAETNRPEFLSETSQLAAKTVKTAVQAKAVKIRLENKRRELASLFQQAIQLVLSQPANISICSNTETKKHPIYLWLYLRTELKGKTAEKEVLLAESKRLESEIEILKMRKLEMQEIRKNITECCSKMEMFCSRVPHEIVALEKGPCKLEKVWESALLSLQTVNHSFTLDGGGQTLTQDLVALLVDTQLQDLETHPPPPDKWLPTLTCSNDFLSIAPLCNPNDRPEQVVVNLFRENLYMKLLKSASSEPELPPVCRNIDFQQTKLSEERRVNEICASLKGAKRLLQATMKECKQTEDIVNFWWEQPVLSVMPKSKTVDGKTFAKWKEEFDQHMTSLKYLEFSKKKSLFRP